DAAYEALLKTRRKELHHRIAQTITEKFAAMAEVRPEVVARHWTQAGEAEAAVVSWKKAGEVADARQAFKEAGEDYRQPREVGLQLCQQEANRRSQRPNPRSGQTRTSLVACPASSDRDAADKLPSQATKNAHRPATIWPTACSFMYIMRTEERFHSD